MKFALFSSSVTAVGHHTKMVKTSSRGAIMRAYWQRRHSWHRQSPLSLRWSIVARHQGGMSEAANARASACARSTVRRWVERHRRTGSHKSLLRYSLLSSLSQQSTTFGNAQETSSPHGGRGPTTCLRCVLELTLPAPLLLPVVPSAWFLSGTALAGPPSFA